MHTDTIQWTVRDTIRIRDDGEHELSEPRTPTEHELRDLRDGYTRVAHWRGDLFCEPSHTLTLEHGDAPQACVAIGDLADNYRPEDGRACAVVLAALVAWAAAEGVW